MNRSQHEIEPEVHSHVATPAEPTAGIEDADFAEIPPHEQTFDETNGSQPRIEAGFEQPFDVAANSPDTDLPTVANETSEGIHQPVAETLVSLPSIGEATPEPEYHAEVIDTAIDDHGRFPDDPNHPRPMHRRGLSLMIKRRPHKKSPQKRARPPKPLRT